VITAPPERLFALLSALDADITATQLALTEPRLGNPKYAMDHGILTSRLESLQSEKIRLLTRYIEMLSGHPATAVFPSPGDWQINITHVGPSAHQTAHARAVISGSHLFRAPDMIWRVFDIEVERMVRSIDALEGTERRPGRPRPAPAFGELHSLMQDDIAILLRLLELGDHPRPVSPHDVMVNEIIPRVSELVAYAALARKTGYRP
jgi:hypothetical protein